MGMEGPDDSLQDEGAASLLVDSNPKCLRSSRMLSVSRLMACPTWMSGLVSVRLVARPSSNLAVWPAPASPSGFLYVFSAYRGALRQAESTTDMVTKLCV